MVQNVYLRIVSFLRKMSDLRKLEENARESDRVIGNLNGYLLEPVNASYAVSNKYYFDDELREELLGTKDHTFKLNKKLYNSLKR